MYIKRLEILGFKTFAEKSVIDFGQGVSSIIGPNGCGKSNIIDAVRWVLGEQSAKSMRGGEMADVIFNGNARRRPSSFSDVSLVIDNEEKTLPVDHVEVSIRRKLFRNGGTEYYLNGKQCRLKDVRELFMDTGIGARTNTVIEQEQLTRLLQASSKERKVLIEEAAGISRFRQRRHESTLKLKHVDENILRLKDIVDEVDKQKRSVSVQASKAKRFENLKKDIQRARLDSATIDLHGWINQRLVFEESRTTATEKITTLRENEEEYQKSITDIDRREQEMEIELAHLQDQQASFFKEYHAVEHALSSISSELENLDREVPELQENVTQMSRDLNASKEDSSSSEGAGDPSGKIAELTEELEVLQEKRRLLGERIDEKRAKLEAKRNWEVDSMRRLSELKNDITREESQQTFFENRLVELDSKEKEFESKGITLGGDADPESLAKAIHEEVEGWRTKKNDFMSEIRRLRSQLGTLELDLRKSVSETSSIRSRLGILKEMEERFEGVGKGVRGVLDLYVREFPDEDRPGGIHGVVADLVEVPEKIIEAIEAALGGRMQNIVTSSAQNAKMAIDFLREKKLGRATFLPLDRIRPRKPLTANLMRYPGVEGEAYDLVDFSPSYSGLFSHLLHGVLVVDHLDHALAISREHRVRIVTLRGDIITPEGSMSGGGRASESGLISRKSEMVELQSALYERESTHSHAEKRHEDLLVEEGVFEKQMESADRELRTAEMKENEIKQKNSMDEREVLRLRQEVVFIQREKENLEKQIVESAEKVKEKKALLDQDRDPEHDGLDEVVEKETLVEWEKEIRVLAENIREVELKKVGISERSESERSRKEMLLDKIVELERRLELSQKILTDKTSRQESLVEEQALKKEAFVQLEAQKDSEQGNYFKLRDQRGELRQKRTETQKAAIEVVESLRKQESKLSQVAVSEERLRVKQEELFSRIHSDFHVDIEEQYYQRLKSEDPLFEREKEFTQISRELKQTVQENESKLSNLGNVNFEAVEELGELERRSAELTEQMDDLTSSQKKISDFLSDLDKTCNEMFAKTFDAVQGYFKDMFQKLFGGGKGELIMESAEGIDPLDAGILISACPPGKSPKVLSQLSGGEKVLTTIAFLFSIFLYKPSPFCILDEIDAPLDEHNVDRFMDAIRSFTDRCQFLIVTHNRRTMSLSDVIHGVTMQENGVSKCISVNMEHLSFDDSNEVSEIKIS